MQFVGENAENALRISGHRVVHDMQRMVVYGGLLPSNECLRVPVNLVARMPTGASHPLLGTRTGECSGRGSVAVERARLTALVRRRMVGVVMTRQRLHRVESLLATT